jgi:hypothetical protein
VNPHPQNLRLFEMLQPAEWEATLGLIKGPPQYSLRRRRLPSIVHPNAKGSQRRRATEHSTGAFAIGTRTGSARPRSDCRDGAREDAVA